MLFIKVVKNKKPQGVPAAYIDTMVTNKVNAPGFERLDYATTMLCFSKISLLFFAV